MDPALYISMTGTKQALKEQTVFSNNLANVNTPGFRQDLYQAQSLYFQGEGLPTQVYSTARESAVDLKSGPIMKTGRELDVAIRGQGWLVIQNENGKSALSRAGNLAINENGLLTTEQGQLVLGSGGPISIPPYQSLQIGEDGSISIVPQGGEPTEISVLDRLLLVNPEKNSLYKGSDGLIYSHADNDYEADANVRVASKSLEGSNVSAVEQMVNMIQSSKSFETQLKLMRSIDENQQALARLLQT